MIPFVQIIINTVVADRIQPMLLSGRIWIVRDEARLEQACDAGFRDKAVEIDLFGRREVGLEPRKELRRVVVPQFF